MDTIAEGLDLTLPGGTCDTTLVRPVDAGPDHRYPAVLFVMDAPGLRPRLVEMARRIAAWGFVVLVPNVYYRQGRAPLIDPALFGDDRAEDFRQRMGVLLRAYTHPMWDTDGPALLEALSRRDDVLPGPVRLTGYCMGAVLALRLAAADPERVAVVVGSHPGGVVTDAPSSPHLLLEQVRCPVRYLYADHDASATPEQQRVFAETAQQAGVDFVGEMVTGAQHGFTMSDRPAYDAAGEQRHWQVVEQMFRD